MRYKESKDFFKQMKQIFGLPSNCVSFDIHAGVDEIVTVKCKYQPEIDENCVEEFKTFYLLVKPTDIDVTNLSSEAREYIVG